MKSILFILALTPTWAQEGPSALEDALWKGSLVIHAGGDLQNQYLANTVSEAGNLNGFTKEKSTLNVDMNVRIDFLVSALGEFTFFLVHDLKGSETTHVEHKSIEEEEQILEGGIKAPLQVQFVENGHRDVKYEGSGEHSESRFSLGHIRMTPKGNMKKKGELHIEGDLTFRYPGEGNYRAEKERQPPSDDYARLFEEAQVKQSLTVPMTFHATVKFKKKLAQGSMSVKIDMENPFKHDDEIGRDIPTNHIKTTGTVTMEALY